MADIDDAYSGVNMELPLPDDAYGYGLTSSAQNYAGPGQTYDAFGNVVDAGSQAASSADPTGLAQAQVNLNKLSATDASGIAGALSKLFSSPAGLAAAGAGLYGMLGGNTPQTGGYKGDIPQYFAQRSRAPQGEYVPYTGKAVMGRQFFTPTTYVPTKGITPEGIAELYRNTVGTGGMTEAEFVSQALNSGLGRTQLMDARDILVQDAAKTGATTLDTKTGADVTKTDTTSVDTTKTDTTKIDTTNLGSLFKSTMTAKEIADLYKQTVGANKMSEADFVKFARDAKLSDALIKDAQNILLYGGQFSKNMTSKQLADVYDKLVGKVPGFTESDFVKLAGIVDTGKQTLLDAQERLLMRSGIGNIYRDPGTVMSDASKLRQFMTENNLTVADVSDLTNIPAQQITSYLNQADLTKDQAGIYQRLNAQDQAAYASLASALSKGKTAGEKAANVQEMMTAFKLSPARVAQLIDPSGKTSASDVESFLLGGQKEQPKPVPQTPAPAEIPAPVRTDVATVPVTAPTVESMGYSRNPADIAAAYVEASKAGMSDTAFIEKALDLGYTQDELKAAYDVLTGGTPDYTGAGMAKGGVARYLRGDSDGMADKIMTSIEEKQPARLSHGEFVIPADVVSHLGNGNSDAGAKVLYKMMDRVRQARTGNKRQGKQINPEKFTPGGIASYATGGAVRFQTGGSTNPITAANPYGATTQTTLSEWAGPYVADMLGRAQALSQTPYMAYTGPLSAGYSPLQQKYFTGLGTLGFPSTLGQSFTGMSTQTGPSGQPMSVAEQYMNPYMQQVLQPQLQAMQRQADIQKSALGAQAARAGAFGGARAGLMQSQLNAELMRQQQQATGQAYQQAYTQGLGQFNVEQQQKAALANALAGAGGVQRDIEQQGISALLGQFQEQQKFPYAQLQFQQSMLQGLPIGTSSVLPNLSPIQQISQAGEQATKLYDLLKSVGLGK